jgi:hypothetical protein
LTTSFVVKPGETVTISFEAKLEKIVATGFEVKSAKTVRVVLRSNHSQTVDLDFEAQPRNPRFLSSRPGADRTRCHPTSRPSGYRVPDLCDYPRSSAPDLLLLPRSSSLHAMSHLPPAPHETSKHDSPNEIKIKEKQNKTIPDSNSNLAKSMTYHNQTKELTIWFLNLPLDESIDNKCTKFEVRIQDLMKHR